jgi:hypothetical protein
MCEMGQTMSRADEYRRRALECLATARTAADEESRAALIQLPQGWLRLAGEQDFPLPAISDEPQQPAANRGQQAQKDEEQ